MGLPCGSPGCPLGRLGIPWDLLAIPRGLNGVATDAGTGTGTGADLGIRLGTGAIVSSESAVGVIITQRVAPFKNDSFCNMGWRAWVPQRVLLITPALVAHCFSHLIRCYPTLALKSPIASPALHSPCLPTLTPLSPISSSILALAT